MPSKLATDHEKAAMAVAAAAETHSTSVASKFKEAFSRYLEPGESMPDIEALIRLVGRAIAQSSKEFMEADTAHESELADDLESRDARDSSTTEVRSVMSDLRATVERAYGRLGLVKIGLEDAIPKPPATVAALGRVVLGNLLDSEIVLPEPSRPALALDRPRFAQDLENALTKLEAALTEVAREVREAEATLVAKHTAKTYSHRVFSRGASWLSATFAASGEDDLASRVRPSPRKPARSLADAGADLDAEAGETAPPVGEPPPSEPTPPVTSAE